MARMSKTLSGRTWNGTNSAEQWQKAAELNEEERPPDADWEWVPRHSIVLRNELSPRAGVDKAVVAEYKAIWDALPPIMVQKDSFVLIDGRHRFDAADGRDFVKVLEKDIPDSELIDAAFLENVRHGLRLKRKEHVEAARQYFLRHKRIANAAIADTCGVARNTVVQWRKAVDEETRRSKAIQEENAKAGFTVPDNTNGMSPEEFADTFGDENSVTTVSGTITEEDEIRVDRHGREFTATPSAPKAKEPKGEDEPVAVDWEDPTYVNGVGWTLIQGAFAALSNREPSEYIPVLDDAHRKVFKARLEDLEMWTQEATAFLSS